MRVLVCGGRDYNGDACRRDAVLVRPINIVDKHPVKEFSLVLANHGVIVCEKLEGAFIVLRYDEDVEHLRALLDTVDVQRLPVATSSCI